ncbi:MAG: TIGR03619 family F420-dependent LLM class oxidoreductase [Gammaproteobacteria bacterium]|nr:TIGR03619 family F420-dependent LLM class oxidoreductase [Gammaproteobacteria bacterium]
MQFWQSLFQCESDQIFDLTKLCEQLGFHGVMPSDHLLHFAEQHSKYPYSPDHKPPSFRDDTPWFDCWTLIAALTAVTKRLHFCTNVYILPLRNPLEVAKATSSVAFFANGRLLLGAGAGWMKEEFDVLGVDFASRGRRYDECIEVIRKLHSGEFVEHQGEFFHFQRLNMLPKPPAPVPILIGGTTEVAMRRAARIGDGWISPGGTVAGNLEFLGRLDQLRREYGTHNRPFDSIVAVFGEEATRDDLRRLEDAGATGFVSIPFMFTIGGQTSLAQKKAALERFAERLMAQA